MKFQPIKMHTDFTTKLGGKAAQLTDGARALGTAVIKRLDAWLLAWAHPPPAGFMSVYLLAGLDGVDRDAVAQRRDEAVAGPRGHTFGPRVPAGQAPNVWPK